MFFACRWSEHLFPQTKHNYMNQDINGYVVFSEEPISKVKKNDSPNCIVGDFKETKLSKLIVPADQVNMTWREENELVIKNELKKEELGGRHGESNIQRFVEPKDF